ncbi:MAG: PrsW family intramembrane metalloprotease [Blautia sp.]|nr:PrsW family intramembrane metalloprotease [Blautia sp.]
MFYFLITPYLTYNLILVAAAIIPAVFLMIKVYNSDRLERESPVILWRLLRAGIFSSLIALVEERILSALLGFAVPNNRLLYYVILYFGIVAFAEESSKYLMLKRNSWDSSEFDCQYDGVVYAVFVSLGFALWENISYVMHYGFGTALIRAITAIPGHACFGVFMGVLYGVARKYANRGDRETSKLFRVLAVVVPALLHGAYDFIASMEANSLYFIGFVVVLFLLSYRLVGRMSKVDHYI